MSKDLEKQENLDGNKAENQNVVEASTTVETPANVEVTATEDAPVLVSQEEFQAADDSGADDGKKAKKAKKPLSKRGKIAIIAGVTVAVVILAIIIALLVTLFKANAPSGPMDNSKINTVTSEINVGRDGGINDKDQIVVAVGKIFPGKTITAPGLEYVKNYAFKGETFDAILINKGFTGPVDISYADADGKNSKTVKLKINDGVNVYTIEEFYDTIRAGKNVHMQANLTETKHYIPKDLGFKDTDREWSYKYIIKSSIYGNGFTYDATMVSAIVYGEDKKETYGGMGVFAVDQTAKDIMIRDFHIIGEAVKADAKDVSLDEFEGNGTLFTIYGADKAQTNGVDRPNITFDHCLMENGQKHIFINGSDVTITNSLLRNGADAIIAVETNTRKGAVLNVENTIISNSVVAGILFCGWTDVGSDNTTACTLNIKGKLEIYNWKDTNTTKLCPATEGTTATIVNNLVGDQIKSLTKDKKAVEKYMYKKGDEFFVHIGIVILATPNLKANKAVVNGGEAIGYVKRGFPIPKIASAIARTCELLGYDQTTTDSSKYGSVKPGEGYGKSELFKSLGFSIVEAAK